MPTGGFYTGAQPIPSGKLTEIGKALFGEKPDVPDLPVIDLPTEQQKAIDANIAAAPKAAELARLSQEQIRAMMRFAFPGYDTATGIVGRNLLDALRGKIPSDVAAMTRLGSAGKALTGGYGSATPGSMGSNLEARDLGLTSYAIMQQGLNSTESWLKSMEQLYSPSAAIYTNMFITPMQEYGVSSHERDLQFQRSWLANQIEAMPNPVARGIFDTVMNLVNSYLGGSYNPSTPNYNPSGVGGGGGGAGFGGSTWGWGGGPASGDTGLSGALGGGTGALGGAGGMKGAGMMGAFI